MVVVLRMLLHPKPAMPIDIQMNGLRRNNAAIKPNAGITSAL